MSFPWDHIAKQITTAEAAATVPTMYQKFRITTGYRNQLLRGVVVGLFFYGLPAFGNVRLELWSDEDGAPGRKLAQSDSYAQAECNTATGAYRIMGFTFSPEIALKKNAYYYLNVKPSAYTGNATSHIAWRQDFPDPKYATGITLSLEFGAKYPFDAAFITADL